MGGVAERRRQSVRNEMDSVGARRSGNSYNWWEKRKIGNISRSECRQVWGPRRRCNADVDGNIGYVMAGGYRIRKKGHGEIPVPRHRRIRVDRLHPIRPVTPKVLIQRVD